MPKRFTDIQLLISDIKRYVNKTKYKIINHDYPQDLIVGWECSKSGRGWVIKISDLKKNKEISKFFTSQAGRDTFLEFLNSLNP